MDQLIAEFTKMTLENSEKQHQIIGLLNKFSNLDMDPFTPIDTKADILIS